MIWSAENFKELTGLAVRNINEVKAAKKSINKYHIIVIVIFALMSTFVISKCVSNYARAAEYNREASAIEAAATAISEESADISETLKAENHEAYFEKIAREEYGYCKPGEKVYYNSSFGE